MTITKPTTDGRPGFNLNGVAVSYMGDEAVYLDYVHGLTAKDYLRQAGVQLGNGQAVLVNGRKASPEEAIVREPDQLVEIDVAGKVSNG